MSNLHLWKTKGKGLAKEYIACMMPDAMGERNYKRMLEIQDEIGIKRA